VTGAVDIAGIERRLADRRIGVRQFVQQEDREVGSDQRNVDDWKAPGRNAVGQGDHAASITCGSISFDTMDIQRMAAMPL
jgi:hypothetical protein